MSEASDQSAYHYDNNSFYIAGGTTALSLMLATYFVVYNLIRHIRTDYNHEIKIGLIICFIDELAIIVLLGLSLFLYKLAQAFLIFVNVLLSIFVIFFFYYVQEILTRYVWKYCNDNPLMKKKLIKEKRNRKLMFKYNYPMDELSFCSKVHIRDLYAKYAYYLQGHGRYLYYFTRKINDYGEAHSFHKENSRIITIYLLTIPIVMIWEYILEETGTIMIGEFNLKAVFRLYILVYTFCATTCMQSFAKSFHEMLPFINFDAQLSTLVYLKTFFDYCGSIVRVTPITMDEYDEFDTYEILFVCIFSMFLSVMCIIQYYVLSPQAITAHMNRSLIVESFPDDEDSESIKSAPNTFKERVSLTDDLPYLGGMPHNNYHTFSMGGNGNQESPHLNESAKSSDSFQGNDE